MAASFPGGAAHDQDGSVAKEFTINDMHEKLRVGRRDSNNSSRSSQLFPLCFPQGFPHGPPENRSENADPFWFFPPSGDSLFMASLGGRFDTESTL